jgi:hypothetical protein
MHGTIRFRSDSEDLPIRSYQAALRSAGPETLGQRLRKEGRLHVDLLQRFGIVEGLIQDDRIRQAVAEAKQGARLAVDLRCQLD